MVVREKRDEATVINAGDVVRFLSDEPKPVSLLVNDGEFNLTQIEKRVMRQAVETFSNQDEAARQLGISLSQLRRKLRDYGIEYHRKSKAETKKVDRGSIPDKPARPDRRAELLRLAATNREFTTQQAIETLGVSRKSVIEYLNQLVAAGGLKKVGRGRYATPSA